MAESTYAFLAQGKLHRPARAGGFDTTESAFGRSLRDRAAQIHNRHAWKASGRGAQFMYGALAANRAADPGEFRVWISSVCRGPEAGSLFYTLETEEVGGIFHVDASGMETRLFHTADFRVRHVATSADGAEAAVAVIHPNFCSNIAVMRSNGTGFQEVTEGESMDMAPSWVAGGGRRIVFQSAGIGRDASGRYTGLGAFAVQLLDLDSGELTTLAEDAQTDFLGPRMSADGSLYYIRRPYDNGRPKTSAFGALKDACLFPFRMSYAIFQYLNFFSMMYTGNPLSAAGNAAQRQRDVKQMMIWGNLIDASKVAKDSDAPSMVPSSWQLVRVASNRTETVANGVLSFDLAANGDLYYSNGSAVFRVASGGAKPERVAVSSLIEQVAVLS